MVKINTTCGNYKQNNCIYHYLCIISNCTPILLPKFHSIINNSFKVQVQVHVNSPLSFRLIGWCRSGNLTIGIANKEVLQSRKNINFKLKKRRKKFWRRVDVTLLFFHFPFFILSCFKSLKKIEGGERDEEHMRINECVHNSLCVVASHSLHDFLFSYFMIFNQN